MSGTLLYRPLADSDCARIHEIDAAQHIARAWRDVDGRLQLVDIDYFDPGFPEGLESHLRRLRQTVGGSGFAVGAFDENGRMIGFSALNTAPFGRMHRYALLDQLYITREHRRQGVGKQLFLHTAVQAKRLHIQKLYICAGSSEETIAFYRALGCVSAVEVSRELFEQDPRDLPLEYLIPSGL